MHYSRFTQTIVVQRKIDTKARIFWRYVWARQVCIWTAAMLIWANARTDRAVDYKLLILCAAIAEEWAANDIGVREEKHFGPEFTHSFNWYIDRYGAIVELILLIHYKYTHNRVCLINIERDPLIRQGKRQPTEICDCVLTHHPGSSWIRFTVALNQCCFNLHPFYFETRSKSYLFTPNYTLV